MKHQIVNKEIEMLSKFFKHIYNFLFCDHEYSIERYIHGETFTEITESWSSETCLKTYQRCYKECWKCGYINKYWKLTSEIGYGGLNKRTY